MSANLTGGGYGAPPAYGSGSGRNTPLSNYGGDGGGGVYAPAPSRPGTNYFDMPMPVGGGGFDVGGGGPSDAELEGAVQDVLRNADLNTVTKREVRRTLEERFGMDLMSRKATINAVIDRVLLSQ
ncbi:hypothetical protein FA15DRAFT_710798 [Coprinopsis marcescibilis]|uniref:DEK-C domain-containing protein n=1 Tax=Coprinopsis marcescibilis TaxID=230819 RepID=A0A5C3KBY8_COPMA|nr:hypothetical protein FA15DRAFT_710798 [Coprinopsis marcescibilis]